MAAWGLQCLGDLVDGYPVVMFVGHSQAASAAMFSVRERKPHRGGGMSVATCRGGGAWHTPCSAGVLPPGGHMCTPVPGWFCGYLVPASLVDICLVRVADTQAHTCARFAAWNRRAMVVICGCTVCTPVLLAHEQCALCSHACRHMHALFLYADCTCCCTGRRCVFSRVVIHKALCALACAAVECVRMQGHGSPHNVCRPWQPVGSVDFC